MSQQEEQTPPTEVGGEAPTMIPLFQPFTNIVLNPEGLSFTHFLAPGLSVHYGIGPESVARIRDEWNRIEAEQAKQKEEMPRPPLGLILPNRRVD